MRLGYLTILYFELKFHLEAEQVECDLHKMLNVHPFKRFMNRKHAH